MVWGFARSHAHVLVLFLAQCCCSTWTVHAAHVIAPVRAVATAIEAAAPKLAQPYHCQEILRGAD